MLTAISGLAAILLGLCVPMLQVVHVEVDMLATPGRIPVETLAIARWGSPSPSDLAQTILAAAEAALPHSAVNTCDSVLYSSSCTNFSSLIQDDHLLPSTNPKPLSIESRLNSSLSFTMCGNFPWMANHTFASGVDAFAAKHLLTASVLYSLARHRFLP